MAFAHNVPARTAIKRADTHTWMTQVPDGTSEKPQLLNTTAELSAETVMIGSAVPKHNIEQQEKRNGISTIMREDLVDFC